MTTGPVLAEAARLARRGHHDTARGLVETLDDPGVAGYDLLARIAAQLGDLDTADRHWATVQQRDPAHAGARDGRRLVAELRSRPLWRKRRGVGAVAVAVALLGGAAVGAALTADDDTALSQRLDRLEALLTEEAEPTRQPVAVADPLDDLAERLRGDGWEVSVADGAATIRFDEPLFAPGTADLTEAGAATLADFAATLPTSDVELTVVGHTSDLTPSGGGYFDNVSLALARGQSGAESLSDSAGIPLGAINVASSGAADPPYANSDDAGRARNQTVTVQVRPRTD